MINDAQAELIASPESLLGEIADDFLARFDRGERPEIETYAQEHPELAQVIREVFPALAAMRECSPAPPAGPARATAAHTTHALGDYRIVRELGRGGMGVVYEAEQLSLGRHVALKVLPFAAALDHKQLQRFKNEAQAAANLHHTNIVPVHGIGCERGVHYYAMQLIEGQTLAEMIADLRSQQSGLSGQQSEFSGQASDVAGQKGETRSAEHELGSAQATAAYSLNITPRNVQAATATTIKGALSTEHSIKSRTYFRTVAQLGSQAAEALEYAHGLGVIHRDIKPGNLLIDARGNLWITDFGLAHVQTDISLTMTGDLVGTLRYMSPEQALAKRVIVDHRTDIYSLGMTLYELLTLSPAFEGRDRHELLRQIAFDEPRWPRRHNTSIPAELETIVLKAIAKNPAERYATAQDLADDLERFMKDEPIRAKRPSLVQLSRKWARRHQPVVWSAAISGALLLAMTVFVLAASNVQIKDEQKQTKAALDREKQAKLELAEALASEKLTQYFQRLSLARRDIAINNTGSAEELLHECPANLRGWEWHLLKRQPYEAPLVVPIGKVWVMHLACSADGRYLATGGFDSSMRGEIKLRDAATGKELLTLTDPVGPVSSVAFQPGGGQLATAGTDGKIVLWDAATQKRLRTLSGHEGPIISLSYRPDGKRLASASLDGTVRVWDLATGAEEVRFRGHGEPVLCVAYSPDGRRIASWGMDTHIRVWDAGTAEEQLRLSGHWHRVFSLLFHKDGRHLVSAGSDGRRIWDLQTGKLERTFQGINSAAFMATFSPDGRRLVFAGCDRTVQVWDWPSGQEVLALGGHTDLVTAVTFSSDGQRLFSASPDGTVRVWNGTPLASGPALQHRPLQGHKGPVFGLAFSPDGRLLATGALDGTARLWDVGTRKLVHMLPGQDISSVAFHAGGRRLTTVSTDGTLVQWDPPTRERRRTLRGHLGPIGNVGFGVGFSADGERLTSLSKDGVRVWETDSGREVVSIPPTSIPTTACLSPDGRRLAVAGFGSVQIMEVESKKRVAAWSISLHVVSHLAFSADGQRLAAAFADGTVRVWEIKTEKHLHTFRHSDRVACVAFHPNGRQLASGSCDNTAKIWDLETGKEVETLPGHIGYVMCLAYSGDGKLLATASGHRYAGEVQLWETATFGKNR